MDRRVAAGAALRQRNLEKARVRLLDPLVGRVQDDIEPRGHPNPIQVRPQRTVGVRHDDEPQAAAAERFQRRQHLVRHVLPEIPGGVIRVQVGQRRGGSVGTADAGIRQDQVEEQPPPARVRRPANDFEIVELAPGLRIRGLQRLGRTTTPYFAERLGDAPPVRVEKDATCVEKNRFRATFTEEDNRRNRRSGVFRSKTVLLTS